MGDGGGNQAVKWLFIIMQWCVGLIIMGAAIYRLVVGYSYWFNFIVAFYLL
jgi:hypothetical protein